MPSYGGFLPDYCIDEVEFVYGDTDDEEDGEGEREGEEEEEGGEDGEDDGGGESEKKKEECGSKQVAWVDPPQEWTSPQVSLNATPTFLSLQSFHRSERSLSMTRSTKRKSQLNASTGRAVIGDIKEREKGEREKEREERELDVDELRARVRELEREVEVWKKKADSMEGQQSVHVPAVSFASLKSVLPPSSEVDPEDAFLSLVRNRFFLNFLSN